MICRFLDDLMTVVATAATVIGFLCYIQQDSGFDHGLQGQWIGESLDMACLSTMIPQCCCQIDVGKESGYQF